MPMTVRLLGFVAPVRTAAARDALREIFDGPDEHTDDTFADAVRSALEETEPDTRRPG